MKGLIFLALTLPGFAWANCPYEIFLNSKQYCLDVQWQNGEKKVQGQFLPSDELSPQLVKMGTVPQKWFYSQAHIYVWQKGDTQQLPVEIPNLKIFPYMVMNNGHHHSTSHIFTKSVSNSGYILSAVAFMEMPGCWSLRWSIFDEEDLNSSQHLTAITDYTNLSEDQNSDLASSCEDKYWQ